MPVRKAVDTAVQIAEGLAAAHSLQVVHRDLKPENVMVTRSGQAKLLDFGLAKQSTVSDDRTASLALSVPGTVMGTAGYMSPEQVRGEPVDTRSDIFSFGCVLYEMLTGKRAFKAPSGVETMHAILHTDPAEFQGDMKMPPALAEIVRRCMEKQPGQRFQSAADLAFALRAIGSGATVAQSVLTQSTITQPALIQPALAEPAPTSVPKPQRRRWFWPLLATLAAIAVFTAGFLLRDRFGKREPVQYQRLTFRKGYVLRARFTPDAHSVVYSAAFENGHLRNYLSIPGNPDSRDLELPDDQSLEAISATQQLALIHDYTLSVASLSGGQMRPLLNGVLAADWSPDGSAMAVLRHVDNGTRLEYPIGTVLVDKIAWPQEMIKVSPDGSRVVFATYGGGSSIQLKVADKSGKITRLGVVSGQGSTSEDATLNWSPKGDEVWFRSFDTATPGAVYAVDMQGHRRVALTLPSRVKLYDISRDGQLLIGTGLASTGILAAGPGDTAEHDLSCLDSGQVRAISDDGKLIVANVTGEAGGPKGAIYLRKMDGSAPVHIADGHAFVLSPDAKTVSGFVQNSQGLKRYTLFPTGPGEESEPHAPGLETTIVLGWLAGENHYLVEGAYKGKKFQCFDWDVKSGVVKPLCPETDSEPQMSVSPDRKLVLVRDWGKSVNLYPAAGGPPQPVHGIGDQDDIVGWHSDNRSVYVRPARDDQKFFPISIVDLITGKITPWKVLRPAQPVLEIHDLQIAPDGAYAYSYVLANSDLYIARGVH